jgi:aspartyl-tRNA(Asn)/glutamyl-tRNA(Gln) amidotransferase subunit A
LAESCLNEIDSRDDSLGCFLHVNPDAVRQQAASAQKRIDEGKATFLTGIPVAVKDNLSTKGLPTTCASKILEGYVPPFDATAVKRIIDQGGVVLGKTNMDEFAMGTSTETSAFQLTRNPWDTSRSPGGSSGGSAAAVSGLMTPLSLGSDTGGSIRQPAALCGIVGFKPSYGRCSRFGLIAFGSSLDQIGPFARCVEDAARLAAAITGHDPRDATTLPCEAIGVPDFQRATLEGKRFAIPKEMMGEAVSHGVKRATLDAIDRLSHAGAQIEEISLPATAFGVTTYYIIAPAEASSNLARFDGIRYGPRLEGKGHIDVVAETRGKLFGHEVKQRIMIGTYALSAGYYDAYYVRAQAVRAVMTAEYHRAFQRYDAILGPTSPIPAFRLGELNDDPLALKLLDICTIPANMGGFPAISLNCGFDEGLPVGLQLIGPHMGDEDLLALAYAVEQALPEAQAICNVPES